MTARVTPIGRRQPYTAIGIARVTCAVRGCREPSQFQWAVCANGSRWLGVCEKHDIALNETTLRFFGFSRVSDRIRAYVRKLRGRRLTNPNGG